MGMIGNAPVAGIISGGNVQDGSIDTIDLKDAAVTTAKLADGGVTSGKVADGAITQAKLNPGLAYQPSGNLSVLTTGADLAANTGYRIAQFDALDSGIYLVSISVANDIANFGNNIIYYAPRWSGVLPVTVSSIYNASPSQTFNCNAVYHHRGVGEPYFYLDSDNSAGSYGRLSLYIVFPQDTRITAGGFVVGAKRLI
jgi:hypothetical protein